MFTDEIAMKILIKNIHCKQNMGRKHNREVGVEIQRDTETERQKMLTSILMIPQELPIARL